MLTLCQEAGVLAVGVVTLDGTKIQADASLGANRSYGFIREQVEAMLSEAADSDAQEDADQQPDLSVDVCGEPQPQSRRVPGCHGRRQGSRSGQHYEAPFGEVGAARARARRMAR